MTSTELQQSPSVACPDWCDCQHPSEWEFADGQLVRGHDIGKCPRVPAGASDFDRCVKVCGYANEYSDATPVEFGITIESAGASLTVAQALDVAQHLTETAHKVQEIQARVERRQVYGFRTPDAAVVMEMRAQQKMDLERAMFEERRLNGSW